MKPIYILIVLFLFMNSNVQAQTALPNIDCELFPANHIYNTRLDTLLQAGQIQVDSRSNAWLNTMGRTRNLRPDFGETVYPEGTDQIMGIPYNVVAGTQPKVAIDYYLYGDDSDAGPMPIPPTALRENGPTVGSGDRHVLVVDDDNCMLYELWYAFKNPDNSWDAGSGAVFDLMSNWLRPLGWTSADAAGLPILPFLPRYEDILAGEMKHPVRFTLPTTAPAYVWPARHGAGNTGVTVNTHPPMGQIFLLNPNFDISEMSPEGQIIATAMKRYGIILADNGSAGYVSGTHDPRWNVGNLLDDLRLITFNDFVAVDICKLRVNPDSGAAAVNANPSGTGCVYNQSVSASGGYAQGRVFDPLGNPWVGVTVTASPYGSSVTDSTGTYLIDEIPRNQNFVIYANGTSLGLNAMWWDNSDTLGGATTLTVSNAMPSRYQRNFVLGQLGDVTGRVFAANGTTPLPNVPVRVDGRNTVVCTNGSGNYTLQLVMGVTYRIGAGGVHANCTDSGRVLRWYTSARTPQAGQGVAVPSANINITLPNVVNLEVNEQLFLAEIQATAESLNSPLHPLVLDIVPTGATITFLHDNMTTGTAQIALSSENGLVRITISATTGNFPDDIRRDLPQMVMLAWDTILARAGMTNNMLEGILLNASAVIFQLLS